MRAVLTSWTVVAALAVFTSSVRADDWPQWLGSQRDGVWRETGLVERFPEGGPKVVWRAPIAGGYAGPAVADGRVYIADWDGEVDKTPDPGKRLPLKGKERVLCLDASSGKQLWMHTVDTEYRLSYPAGPRCTPTVSGGKVYALGAMGKLTCLDAAAGRVIWEKDLRAEYKTAVPVWGYAAHPLVDGQKLICMVGGEGSVAVAFDKDTGKELWRALYAKEPGYCPPSIIEAGGKRQLVVWTPEAVNGLDPETGKAYWSIPLEPSHGMAIAAPRKSGDYLFATAYENVGAVIKLAKDKPEASVVWIGTPKNSLYVANATPFIDGETIYGNDAGGSYRAVDLLTGDRLWETFAPINGKKLGNGTVFQVKNGDRFVMFNELGELILARLNRQGYQEISRAKIIEPTGTAWGRALVWSHPAFANKCVFARNDKEIVCVSLAAP